MLGDVGVLVEAEDEIFNAWLVDSAALRGSICPIKGVREESPIVGIDSGGVGVGWEGELEILGTAGAGLIGAVGTKAGGYIHESAHPYRWDWCRNRRRH